MEIVFESLYAALESTRGTAVNPPTRWLPIAGTLDPAQTRWRPEEARGLRAANYRSLTTRRWCELGGGQGPLDTQSAHFLAVLAVNGASVSPTSPSANSRLWTFNRAMSADNLRAMTIYGMDPNVQQFRSSFFMLDEWTITADAGAEDGVTQSIAGMGQFPSATAASSLPTVVAGPLLNPGLMQVALDTSSAMGTTNIDTLVSAELTIPTGVKRKWGAAGASASLGFQRIGLEKTAPTLKLTFEVAALSQVYNLFANNNGDSVIRARWRVSGPEIDTNFRHYLEVDLWGTCEEPAWDELEGTNRTFSLELVAEYDATAATDMIMRVQNTQASL